ncbi:MAG: hypothetical protein [Bacteriophage sp.]|nr:MAG: hypothetical protein [Bacteriophage sp.]
MNKNFDLGAKQRSHYSNHIEQRTDRAKRRNGERAFRGPSILRFSYKGIILRKEENVYYIDKQIMISGADVSMVEGVWTNGPLLQHNIDYMLEEAKPERLAEVREAHRNWFCPHCKNVTLYDKADEGQTDGGFRYICCRCCFSDVFLENVQTAPDTVMR